VGTNIFGVIFRVVGYYTKKTEKDIMGIKTHNGEFNKKNTVSKKVSTLKASNSARYQKKNFRNENQRGRANIIALAEHGR
jgi:hypothetical protein